MEGERRLKVSPAFLTLGSMTGWTHCLALLKSNLDKMLESLIWGTRDGLVLTARVGMAFLQLWYTALMQVGQRWKVLSKAPGKLKYLSKGQAPFP